MASASLAKQNFSTAAEDALNQQIQVEQIAEQVYMSASGYFGHADVALPVTSQQHIYLILTCISS